MALITDNAPTHIICDYDVDMEHGLKVINLSHIKLVFLPANVTSVVQPLDQGIIAAFKAHYRRQLVRWLISESDKPGNEVKMISEFAPDLYHMMQWVHSAWSTHVSQETIRNCWRKAGIVPNDWFGESPAIDDDVVVAEYPDALQELQSLHWVTLLQHHATMQRCLLLKLLHT